MNPGVAEEASKAAQSTIEALKSTPVVLALVIFNVLFMVLMAWTTRDAAERWEGVVNNAFKYCQEYHERDQRMRLQSEQSHPVDPDKLPPIP